MVNTHMWDLWSKCQDKFGYKSWNHLWVPYVWNIKI